MSLQRSPSFELCITENTDVGVSLDMCCLYVPLYVPLVSVVLLTEVAAPELDPCGLQLAAGLLLNVSHHLVLLHKHN